MTTNLKEKLSAITSNTDSMQLFACYLLMLGLLCFPIHLRYALLQDTLKLYGQINYFFFAAFCIFLYTKIRDCKYERFDGLMTVLWLCSLLPVLCSNYSMKTAKTVVVLCNLVLPIFLLLYRFDKEQLQKFMRHFLILYDVFIVILLVCAFVEKFSHNAILIFANQLLSSKEYAGYLGNMEVDVWRFYSVWGHALSNAIYFNLFFILNDVYFRSMGKKYPKIFFFLISLLGVLFCSSKTAIVVLFAYMLVSSWRDKRIMFGGGVAVTLALGFGGFDILLERFKGTTLTTGRFESIRTYFQSGICPLGFFKGYGSGFVYKDQLYELRAGFEFPVMMSSLDYGILFTLLTLAGIYIYVSYFMLIKKREVVSWIGFSLMYAQFNTYNGLSLSNQDCFTWACVMSMLMVNCAVAAEPRVKKIKDAESKKKKRKQTGGAHG